VGVGRGARAGGRAGVAGEEGPWLILTIGGGRTTSSRSISPAGTAEITLDEVERALEIRPDVMRMRISNFGALAGKGGLGSTSRQSRAVFERYKDTPGEELRELALAIIRERGEGAGPS
jgi:hypothetical protein